MLLKNTLHIAAIMLVVPFVLLASGCALDPMDRLSEDIRSQDTSVREAAVLQLANLNDDRAVDALVDVLQGDDDLCDRAGVALVKKGREVNEPDPQRPNPVVDAVGRIVGNAHLAENFRARAAWVLGEIGDRRAIPALQAGQGALTGERPALLVREESKKALEKLGYFSAGRDFEYGMRTFTGTLEILPQPQPLVLPEAG